MKIKGKYILLIAIILLLVSGAVFYLRKDKKEADHLPDYKPGVVANIKRTVDASSWDEYVNSELGFSIKLPPEVSCFNRCSQAKKPLVPIKVFQDNKNNTVYITPEYYYDYGDNSNCEKIEASLASLEAQGMTVKPFLAWKIDVIKADNLDDVNNFIKRNFASSCMVGSQTMNNDGVYEIGITGEDWANGGMVNSNCYWEMHYKILYSPEKHKLLSVKLPIDYDFFISDDSLGGLLDYGQEMAKSLKLE